MPESFRNVHYSGTGKIRSGLRTGTEKIKVYYHSFPWSINIAMLSLRKAIRSF